MVLLLIWHSTEGLTGKRSLNTPVEEYVMTFKNRLKCSLKEHYFAFLCSTQDTKKLS